MKEPYTKRTYLYFHLYEEQAKLAYSGKKSEYCLTLEWEWGLMGHWQEVTINVLLTDKAFIVAVRSLSHVPLFATPRTCSTSGFPVLHYLPEFAQTHVHQVSDAIQPSQPLSSPSPPAFNLSQYQGLSQ